MKITMIILFLSAIASAKPGNDQGGGGSRIESAFRLSATTLINEVAKNKTANDLCPAAVMSEGLNKADIQIVETLENHLDAWTKPGLIKLKKSSWSKNLGDNDMFAPSLAALILHEVYRTTNDCDDDTGALSTAVIKILQGRTGKSPHKFKKVMALVYKVRNPDISRFSRDTYKIGSAYIDKVTYQRVKSTFCDHELLSKGSNDFVITCLMTVEAKFGQDPLYATFIIRSSSGNLNSFNILGVLANTQFTKGHYDYIESNAAYITQENPLYLIFDMSRGYYMLGLDLENMISF